MAIQRKMDLDADTIGAVFTAHTRIQIADFLEAEAAKKLARTLAEVPWATVFNSGTDNYEVPQEQMEALSEEEYQKLVGDIHSRASKEYQFFYLRYPMVKPYFDAKVAGRRDKGPLADFFEFLNSKEMLDFMRRLTGRKDIKWIDGQATLYRAGHFLSQHDDRLNHHKRIAAYVLNLTSDWHNDWGGYLQFFDRNGDVEHALKPCFNALNLFSVPQDHAVQYVAPYASGLRYSVTGWCRADDPPGKIGC